MGSGYLEEKLHSFYDPQQDWEGLRAGPPHHRSTPVSPRGPRLPRASPPRIYPPKLDHRSRLPSSPHEQPFSPYDLEEDLREGPRQGMNAPIRPSKTELGLYNQGLQNPHELDSHSRGAGRGTTVPPLYVNPNANHLSIPQGASPNGRYRPQAPPIEGYGRGVPPSDGYRQEAPPNDTYGRGIPPNESYTRRISPNESFVRGAPPNDNYAQRIPPNESYARGAPPSDGYGRGVSPNDNFVRGAPPNDGTRRGALPNDSHVQGTPLNDSYARGVPPNDSYRHGAPPNRGYGHEASPNDIYKQGVPPNDTFRRGSLESGYAGRGISGRASGTPSNNYNSPESGTRPLYGEESSGYTRGLGRGHRVVPLGDGRYEYGGLHQLERVDMVEDYNGGASQPAPISSEYAHQVYASVFSDPVYGGARQLNSHAGYHEESNLLQQEHLREDVLRHPNDF